VLDKNTTGGMRDGKNERVMQKDYTVQNCGQEYSITEIHQTCKCGSPLLVRYDLKEAKKHFSKEMLNEREKSLWRYRELLPVQEEKNIVTLGEGFTPLVSLERAGAQSDIPELYMKDEGIIPTGTFKARGAAVGVSRAKELGVQTLIMPTNGNAGAAWRSTVQEQELRQRL